MKTRTYQQRPVDRLVTAQCRRAIFFLVAMPLASVCNTAFGQDTPALQCQLAVRDALGTCITTVASAQTACHAQTGDACASTDPVIGNALSALDGAVADHCTVTSLRDAGLGDLTTIEGLSTRLRETCTGNVTTISTRTYGGPLAVLLDGANAATESCLLDAAGTTGALLPTLLAAYGGCVEAQQRDGSCALADTLDQVNATVTLAEAEVTNACPGSLLADTIGLAPAAYVAQAAQQSECLVGASFGETSPLDLSCGPIPPPPPGVATPITIDDTSVARCGDGSPYRFWVNWHDTAALPTDTLIYLQGGGVCTMQGQCEAVASNNPGLFTSQDDNFPNRGMLSDAVQNPFRNRTRVYLPYCTQDVFIGGGATQVYSDALTVERYGARNVRAALAEVRNRLWGEQRHTSSTGYLPSAQRVTFAGNSAGGFGALYNYHHLLDDLRWQHTNAVPGAAMALDNGQGTGLLLIGALVQSQWAARSVQPSYCQDTACAVGPLLASATSQRLTSQRLLWVSNQVDTVQANTTNFADSRAWTNALRASYCANQNTPNVDYFLSASPNSTHGMLANTNTYLNIGAAGVPLTAWLADAGGYDAVAEGALAVAGSGVAPFDCVVDNADSDGDGIGAQVDNCLTEFNPQQIDTDSDGHGNACDTDLNNDCTTNAADLGLFRKLFFQTNNQGDFNGDGVTNFSDLGILRLRFFQPPGPSADGLCDL